MRSIITKSLLLASFVLPKFAMAEETSCTERVYQFERLQGADHDTALKHANEVCNK